MATKNSQKEFNFLQKLAILLVVVGLPVFVYVSAQVFGATFTLGRSILPSNLDADLAGHWTFDGDAVSVTETSGFDLTGAVHSTTSDISTNTTNPQDIAFSDDGFKMFIADPSSTGVDEYTLGVAYDPMTATYDSSYNASMSPLGLAFNNDGTKMFLVQYTDDTVREYTLSVGFDISSTVTYIDSFDLTGEMTAPETISFNSDGTKMYIPDYTDVEITEYELSTAFDVSTASSTYELDVSGQLTQPQGHVFNTDGTKLFVTSAYADRIYEYTLSTAFLLSSATYVGSLNTGTEDLDPEGLAFSLDGSEIFLLGNNDNALDIYRVPWSVDAYSVTDRSTNSYTGSTTGSVTAVPGKVGQGFKFDGNESYVNIGDVGWDTNTVAFWVKTDEVSTTTSIIGLDDVDDIRINGTTGQFEAYGVTSANFYVNGESGNVSISPGTWYHVVVITPFPTESTNFKIGKGAHANEFKGVIDDVRVYGELLSSTEIQQLYHLGATTHVNSSIQRDNLDSGLVAHWTFDGDDFVVSSSTAYDVSTATYRSSVDISTNTQNTQDIVFSNDGLKMFVADSGDTDVDEYILTKAYAPETATYESSYDTSQTLLGMAFNDDGTQMYVSEYITDTIREYTLSTAFDLSSTVTYIDNLDVSVAMTQPEAMVFNNDGTKVYIPDYIDEEVTEYDLSPAYDISSGSSVYELDISGDVIRPQGIALNDDGTKLFVGSSDHDKILEYELSTAWDISSATYIDSLTTTSGDTHIEGFAFNPGGTKIFALGNGDDDVDIYTIPITISEYVVQDRSGNNYHGTTTNGTHPVSGKVGQGALFDGVDDYIDIGSVGSALDVDTGTISGWIKPEAMSTTGMVFDATVDSSNNIEMFWKDSTSELIMKYKAGGTAVSVAASEVSDDGAWYFVVLTWDTGADELKGYVNGVQSGSTLTGLGTWAGSVNAYTAIGAQADATRLFFWDGKIDDLRIYDRALTSAEITQLYGMGL